MMILSRHFSGSPVSRGVMANVTWLFLGVQACDIGRCPQDGGIRSNARAGLKPSSLFFVGYSSAAWRQRRHLWKYVASNSSGGGGPSERYEQLFDTHLSSS